MQINSFKIKTLMLDKGLTIQELANNMNSSRQWLGAILDQGHATIPYIKRLATALEVDPKEIVKLEE